jgi:hypothetical protein
MTNDKTILTSLVTLSDYDLMAMDLDFIKRMVKERIARGLAREIEKKVEIIERPNFALHSKEFEARVVVMTMEEYREQRAIIRSLEERVEELERLENAVFDAIETLEDAL